MKFTLRFENPETHELLRLLAERWGISMNRLAEDSERPTETVSRAEGGATPFHVRGALRGSGCPRTAASVLLSVQGGRGESTPPSMIHVMAKFDPLGPAAQAKRVLFGLGLELPGQRAVEFAVRVRTSVDDSPHLSPDARIRQAMAEIEDGPLALVADEPELQDEPLSKPAASVAEAANCVVYALGQRLFQAPEPPQPPQ